MRHNYLKIFNQETMSDEDKKTVALLSKKIRSMCDVRLIQYYTRNQQDEFIKQLPQYKKKKIEKGEYGKPYFSERNLTERSRSSEGVTRYTSKYLG